MTDVRVRGRPDLTIFTMFVGTSLDLGDMHSTVMRAVGRTLAYFWRPCPGRDPPFASLVNQRGRLVVEIDTMLTSDTSSCSFEVFLDSLLLDSMVDEFNSPRDTLLANWAEMRELIQKTVARVDRRVEMIAQTRSTS